METSYISTVTDVKQRPSKCLKEMARGKDMLQNELLWIQLKVNGEVLLNLHLCLKYFVR